MAESAPLLLLLTILTLFPVLKAVPFAVTVPAAILLGVVLSTLRRRRRPPAVREPAWLALLARALVVFSAAVSATMLVTLDWGSTPTALVWALGALGLGSAVVVTYVPRAFWVHLALQGLVFAAAARWVVWNTDVTLFVRGSAAELARGGNPYALTFRNPYDSVKTELFWSPDFIDSDRIMIGFPYMPSTLFPLVPAHLLGEVRWVSVAALVGASALLWRLATDPVGRLLAVSLTTSPMALRMTVDYAVEPMVVLYMVVLVWAVARGRRRWAALGVALLLASKQYLVVILPLEKLVRRRIGLRAMLVGVAGAAVLVIGAFLLEPRGFWDSVVAVQFAQPFRADSTSLAVELVNLGVPVPKWALSIGSLVAGLGVALWVRFRAPAGATWLALGIGMSLLATVLLSKQAFANYFLVVQACVIAAATVWPRELASGRPSADRTSSSGPAVPLAER